MPSPSQFICHQLRFCPARPTKSPGSRPAAPAGTQSHPARQAPVLHGLSESPPPYSQPAAQRQTSSACLLPARYPPETRPNQQKPPSRRDWVSSDAPAPEQRLADYHAPSPEQTLAPDSAGPLEAPACLALQKAWEIHVPQKCRQQSAAAP